MRLLRWIFFFPEAMGYPNHKIEISCGYHVDIYIYVYNSIYIHIYIYIYGCIKIYICTNGYLTEYDHLYNHNNMM